MRKVLISICLILILSLWLPVSAEDLTAPPVTGEADSLMPPESSTFAADIWYVIRSGIQEVLPDVDETCRVALLIFAAVLLQSIVKNAAQQRHSAVNLCGIVCISCILLKTTNSMVNLGANTVTELSNYGMQLFPVLTVALAAQGGISSSTTLCAGTTLFNAILAKIISNVVLPLIYVYLAVAIVSAAIGEKMITKLKELIRNVIVWALRIVLYIFTGYISITGAVSGSVDQAALKAAKVTISSAVPVVGNIMADASESILVGAGVVKNTVGIYGCIAVIALLCVPFLKLTLEYGVIKLTCVLCGVFTEGKELELLEDFGRVQGLLIAMTGAVSLMLLISIVCFLKGMST